MAFVASLRVMDRIGRSFSQSLYCTIGLIRPSIEYTRTKLLPPFPMCMRKPNCATWNAGQYDERPKQHGEAKTMPIPHRPCNVVCGNCDDCTSTSNTAKYVTMPKLFVSTTCNAGVEPSGVPQQQDEASEHTAEEYLISILESMEKQTTCSSLWAWSSPFFRGIFGITGPRHVCIALA